MSKLFLIFWGLFSISCGNISNTPKNVIATKTEEASDKSDKEVIAEMQKIQKTDSIQVDDEIVEAPSLEKIIKNKPKAVDTPKNSTTKVIKTDNTQAADNKIVETSKERIVEESSIETSEKEKDAPIIVEDKIGLWNELLAKHVNSNGDVAYNKFLKDKNKLESYLDFMAVNSPQDGWSKKEKLVYYINIYNAGTVKLILDNYPTKSIKNINKPWGKKIIKIGDNIISLGDIEHKILRKMNEPRIHFAINCASYSCPKLINKAFTVSNLEKMLEAATIDFINDSKRNEITADKLQLSNIFKWYKKDFINKDLSLIDYINPYIKINIKEKANISYLKYDWSLNEAK